MCSGTKVVGYPALTDLRSCGLTTISFRSATKEPLFRTNFSQRSWRRWNGLPGPAAPVTVWKMKLTVMLSGKSYLRSLEDPKLNFLCPGFKYVKRVSSLGRLQASTTAKPVNPSEPPEPTPEELLREICEPLCEGTDLDLEKMLSSLPPAAPEEVTRESLMKDLTAALSRPETPD